MLGAEGNSVASLDAPEGDWIHRANGTPVQQRNNAPFYAVLQTGILPRSLLSIYNSDGKITYQGNPWRPLPCHLTQCLGTLQTDC